jgi:hypothetical protein
MKAFIAKLVASRGAIAVFVAALFALVNQFHTLDVTTFTAKTMSGFDALLMALNALVVLGLVRSAHKAPPPAEKKPNVTSIVLVGPIALLIGCGSPLLQTVAENPGDTAEFLAQQACAKHYAAKRSIDLAQAQEDFCASRPNWLPWLKPILDALARGDERAMARDARSARGE